MFKDKRYQEITGTVFFLVSLLILLSLVSYHSGDYAALLTGGMVKNIIGPLGSLISHILRIAFGIASYLVIPMFIVAGLSVIQKGTLRQAAEKIFSIFFLTIVFSALMSLLSDNPPRFSGGYVGVYQHHFLTTVAGTIGGGLIIVIMNIVGMILLGIVSLSMIIDAARGRNFAEAIKHFRVKAQEKKMKKKIPLNSISLDENPTVEEKSFFIKKMKYNTGTRLPWITRKTIIIPAGETGHERRPLKYLEMQVPIAVKNREASPSRYYEPDEVTFPVPGNSERDDMKFMKENNESPVSINGRNRAEYISDRETEQIEGAPFSEDDEYEFYADDDLDYPNQELDAGSQEIVCNRIKSIDDEERAVSKPEEPFVAGTVKKTGSVELSNKTNRGDDDLARSEPLVFSEIRLNRDYIIPTDFLKISNPSDSESWLSEVKKNSALLVNTLADFGIESRVVNVNRGPVITLFELQIAPGIKVNRIVGLADDIAMALAAYRVRIVAPIPGKSAIGVEIPNRMREKVTLGDIIHTEQYIKKEGCLKVALGKDILGKPITLDLKKLPHLLIAGATGSGKSVCVNTIICSLVYNYDPNYVRFILVDPKMVELQLYNGLPHLLTPVITEPFVAPNVLKWAVYEMERRYRLLSEMNTRDMERYNEKIRGTGNRHEHLPYIVIIIDELADLMMVACKEIEGFITRIAQKARAVGIHLVLATQRPSVDIITGIIKANFPARIAFQVAQKTDSRTIIDQNGAEKLLGKGDMLFQSPNGSYPVRIQGAFVSEDEIMTVVDHLSVLGEPEYIDIEESLFNADADLDSDGQGDELFVEALKIVEETRKASASYLQRRLSIGYNRAARIIETMEDRGYIGPQQGSKPREVLI
ncbi:MAG TPA: DNA translocase FtsK [Spirochaetota bacterium]|nr:DNA translocase FtsK [Spirochaetota bacterium]HPI87763.1 DNA translocase FtsK [Spirochaetota bacterium]HPR50027.1 DNA translocase FtsK [Spirochaetota bacterium]